MAGEWSTSTEEAWDIHATPNATDENLSSCNVRYLPTIAEAKEALGAFGVTFVVIGGIVTCLLYILFIEQLVFTFRYAHKVYRRHIYWITSIYPLMTLMTVISIVMPRADTIASGIKAVYMCIGFSHFIDLTELMFGSEKVMLAKLEGKQCVISTGPSCCCCLCLPTIKFTQNRLRLVRWMVWQMPYLQSLYFTLAIFINIAQSDENGMVNPNNGFLWLQIINFVSFMCGVWALNIMAANVRDLLEHYGYGTKAFLVKICVLVTRFQSFVLDILALFNIYPCYGPYISPRLYKILIEQTLYMLEMIILGPLTYWHFRSYAFLTKNPTEVSALPESQLKCSCVSVVSKMSMAEKRPNPNHSIIDPAHQRTVIEIYDHRV